MCSNFASDAMGMMVECLQLDISSRRWIYKKLKNIFQLNLLTKTDIASDEETIFCMILNGIEAIKM